MAACVCVMTKRSRYMHCMQIPFYIEWINVMCSIYIHSDSYLKTRQYMDTLGYNYQQIFMQRAMHGVLWPE